MRRPFFDAVTGLTILVAAATLAVAAVAALFLVQTSADTVPQIAAQAQQPIVIARDLRSGGATVPPAAADQYALP